MKSKMLAVLLVSAAVATAPSGTLAQTPTDWKIYKDERYDFTIEYPASWLIIPRDDREGSYGGVLTFTPVPPSADTSEAEGAVLQVVVGLHTMERNPQQSPADWTQEYLRKGSYYDVSEIRLESLSEVPLQAGGVTESGYRVRGVSPKTPFEVTHIPRGNTMWFIWTNATAPNDPVYTHMVESLRFGEKTPNSLTEAFGSIFQPQNHTRSGARGSIGNRYTTAVIGLPDSYWYVPTPAGQAFTVNCGSPYHTGLAQYAADVSMVAGTGVYAIRSSWIDWTGWDSTGYGNLMKTSTNQIAGRYYATWYAHLNSFARNPGEYVGTSGLIAYSGSTGTQAAHLHFHTFSVNDAVDLRNLNNFAENGYYPSGYAACGTMSR